MKPRPGADTERESSMYQLLLDVAAEEVQPSLLSSLWPLILMFGLLYLIMIRPQRKRQKEEEAMRAALDIGDEIITSGGIVGRVVSIQDDTLLIETGAANTKIRILKGAIQANNTQREAAVAAAQAEQEEKKPRGLFGRLRKKEEEQ